VYLYSSANHIHDSDAVRPRQGPAFSLGRSPRLHTRIWTLRLATQLLSPTPPPRIWMSTHSTTSEGQKA